MFGVVEEEVGEDEEVELRVFCFGAVASAGGGRRGVYVGDAVGGRGVALSGVESRRRGGAPEVALSSLALHNRRKVVGRGKDEHERGYGPATSANTSLFSLNQDLCRSIFRRMLSTRGASG